MEFNLNLHKLISKTKTKSSDIISIR